MKLQNEFGFMDEIEKIHPLLRDRFIEPPFSVLDTKQGAWQDRKRAWSALGIKGEIGRGDIIDSPITNHNEDNKGYISGKYNQGLSDKDKRALGAYASFGNSVIDRNGGRISVSIFDPVLTELMYTWFCPPCGYILDPFAGGSVRGIIAHYLGYHYDGIELRQEQVDSNREQAMDILPLDNQPQWYVGDSNKILVENKWLNKFDFIFSCPPYADLEKYSELPEDISNMPYHKFKEIYSSIIRNSINLLNSGSLACFVVGEVRGKDSCYYNLTGDTKSAFIDAGAKLYNDAVLLNPAGSAPIRASNQFETSKKLIKLHQNVLIFKKI